MTETTLILCKGSINNIAGIIVFISSIAMKCVMLLIQIVLIIPMLLCSLLGIGLLAGFLTMLLLSVFFGITLI